MASQYTPVFRLSGHVRSISTDTALSALPVLRVELWDKGHLCPDLVDCAVTGAGGHFEVRVDAPYLERLFPGRDPELFFRVLNGNQVVASTEGTVVWRPRKPHMEVVIPIQPSAESTSVQGPAAFVVRGRVFAAMATRASGYTVRAYDRNLGANVYRDDLLGEAVLNAAGEYQVRYSLGPNTRPGKIKADLVVRVLDPDGLVLAESRMVCHAPTSAWVDVVVGGEIDHGLSEYEELITRIAPALAASYDGVAGGGGALADLSDDVIAYLACSFDVHAGRLRLLRDAARLSRETRIAIEVFYGLLRRGLPASLRGLIAQTTQLLRRALEWALSEHIVPGSLSQSLGQILPLLEQAIVDHALQPCVEPGKISFGDALSTSLQPHATHRAFVSRYIARSGSVREFWAGLAAAPELQEPGVVDDLRLTLQIAILLQRNLPLMKEMRAVRLEGVVQSLRDLTQFDAAAWKQLLRQAAAGGAVPIPPHIPGQTAEARTDNYIAAILDTLKTAYPESYLYQGPDQDPEMYAFVVNAPGFSFKTTHIDRYLQDHPQSLECIALDRRQAVKQKLKATQRMLRVVPRPEHVTALLSAGFDSASRIARVPRKRFVKQLSAVLGGDQKAREAHARACRKAAAAQHVHITLKQTYTGVLPRAIGGDGKPDFQHLEMDGLPDWEALFGPAPLCDCEMCSSVHGPAAYFVDLLHFLDQGDKKPIDALFARRPDLQQLLLTCENTNTPLPYIDIVNEVLESYIQIRFGSPPGDPTTDLPAFNTGSATAEELRAIPKHVSDAAYELLRQAVYPPALPFNRPLEVARTYLEHLGTSRYEVLKTFRRDGEPPDRQLTAEFLRLSPEEYDIIAGLSLDPPRELREFFGYVKTTWKVEMARVPECLLRTGVTYAELVELLRTSFINRDQAEPSLCITLESGAAECDPENTTITHLTDAALDRMHRFIRLWRRLGWTVADLDRALAAMGAMEIDEVALRKLAELKRIAQELDRPAGEVVGLWADENATADDRRAWLANALRISVPDLRVLLELTGIDPFQVQEPGAAVTFIEQARKVERSGFSVALVDYLATDRAEPTRSPAPTEAATEAVLKSIQDQLRKIRQDTVVPPAPPGGPAQEATDEMQWKLDLRDQLSRTAVAQGLAGAFDVAESLLRQLLETVMTSRIEQGRTAMDDFLALASTDVAGPQSSSFRVLHKVTLLIGGFRLTEREVLHLSAHKDLFGGFNLDALAPSLSAADTAAPAFFEQWERVYDFVSVRDSLPRTEKGLIDLFELAATQAELPALRALLAEMTGWPPAEIETLTGSQGFGFTASDFRTDKRLLQLKACVGLVRRAGVSASKLFTWASTAPSPALAQEIVQAAKGRHEHPAWLEVARGLNDTLRERQRSALVAYLIPRMHDEGIRAERHLFDYFLIDVKMCACMATSRIQQATASVQHFVQRCLLHLEPDVNPEAIDADQWKWRKSYRVWEANRKVFLYPENWIEPELRDDKSAIFKELEAELIQNDVTTDTAEQAFLKYLEKLDEIARLEVCGLVWQNEPAESNDGGGIDILHVFGRTFDEPRVYCYRRLVNHREWTAWERIHLDIQGDQLIPALAHGRLRLFWPVFMEKATAAQVSGDGAKPSKYWEIKLAFSEYVQGRWSAKGMSSAWVKVADGGGQELRRAAGFHDAGREAEVAQEAQRGIRLRRWAVAVPSYAR